MDTVFLLAQIFPHALDSTHVARVVVRLVVAAVLGGIIGLEREEEHKSAGMRTQMLVALGTALLVMLPLEMETGEVSRVIQGVAAGIGFLGAGTIFKMATEEQVKGLTTAASVWVTAAVGVAVGLGAIWPAVLAVGLAWIILRAMQSLEERIKGGRQH